MTRLCCESHGSETTMHNNEASNKCTSFNSGRNSPDTRSISSNYITTTVVFTVSPLSHRHHTSRSLPRAILANSTIIIHSTVHTGVADAIIAKAGIIIVAQLICIRLTLQEVV